jgi:hypothetical protein
MNVLRAIGLSVLALLLVTVVLSTYLFGQRYQVSATHDTLFVVDAFTGDINAYMVARPRTDFADLKVVRVAVSE